MVNIRFLKLILERKLLRLLVLTPCSKFEETLSSKVKSKYSGRSLGPWGGGKTFQYKRFNLKFQQKKIKKRHKGLQALTYIILLCENRRLTFKRPEGEHMCTMTVILVCILKLSFKCNHKCNSHRSLTFSALMCCLFILSLAPGLNWSQMEL